MPISSAVSSYTVRIFSPGPDDRAFAEIFLMGSTAHATLRFYPGGRPLPPNSVDYPLTPTFGYYDISMRYAQFPGVVDLLRNEGPSWFIVGDPGAGDAIELTLHTGAEAPGEGE